MYVLMYKLKILYDYKFCARNGYFQGAGSENTFTLICF